MDETKEKERKVRRGGTGRREQEQRLRTGLEDATKALPKENVGAW